MTRLTAAPLAPSAYQDRFARDHLPPPGQWPDFHFARAYPERLNCVAALLDAAQAGGAERIAIYADGLAWSYAELQRQVDRIAHVLHQDLGLVSGNRVLLRGANNPMMAACLLAVLKAGCIAVPTMPLLRARELTTIADKASVDAILCSANLRGEIDALAAPPARVVFFNAPDDPEALEQRMARHAAPFAAFDSSADDVCLISFTSGTTGVPKGTMHFHRDLLAICDCFPVHTLRAQADDIFIGTPPLAFTFGLGGLLLVPMGVGAAAVLLEKLSPDWLRAAI